MFRSIVGKSLCIQCEQIETGKQHQIYAQDNFSFKQIRLQLALKTKSHPKEIMLVFQGAQINDEEKLSQLNLKDNKIKINFILLKQKRQLDKNKNIKIQLKTLKGQILPVEVNLMHTVKEVKQIIFSLYNFQCCKQKLIFNGSFLNDQQILQEVNVKKGDFLVLMFTAPIPKKIQYQKSEVIKSEPKEVQYQKSEVIKQSNPSQVGIPLTKPQVNILFPKSALATKITQLIQFVNPQKNQLQKERQNTISDIMAMGFARKDIQRIMAKQNNAHKIVDILINGKQEPSQENKQTSKQLFKVNQPKPSKKISFCPKSEDTLNKYFEKNEKIEKKQQKIKKIDEYNENECKICMSKQSEMVCTPCFHMCVCQKCSQGLKGICPICRDKGQFKKIFKS